MKIYSSILSLVTFTALASCGSDGGSVVSPPTPGEAKIASFQETLVELGPDHENLQPVSPSALPNTATMTGTLAMQGHIQGVRAWIGVASATADFAGGQLSGSVTNITEYALSGDCQSAVLPDGCIGTVVQDLDGGLTLDGTITGTSFDYHGSGVATGTYNNAPQINSFNYSGTGDFGTLNGNLVALGSGTNSTVNVNNNGFEQQFFTDDVLILKD